MPKRKPGPNEPVIDDIPQWKITYLLEGKKPPFQTFETLIFCGAQRYHHTNRSNKRHEAWYQLWQRIKDEPVVKEWKRKHGKTFAERIIEQY